MIKSHSFLTSFEMNLTPNTIMIAVYFDPKVVLCKQTTASALNRSHTTPAPNKNYATTAQNRNFATLALKHDLHHTSPIQEFDIIPKPDLHNSSPKQEFDSI